MSARQRDVRTGLGIGEIKRDFLDNLFYLQARFPEVANLNDFYQALSYTVRDRLLERWVRSARLFKNTAARTVCYFSAEYMLGPQLGANLLSLGITEEVREAMAELGLDLETLIEYEPEPGLGNGGLGRLAACFMESLATLQVPAIGYGIRYEFGIFRQEIREGWQVECSDRWHANGNPWEIRRPTITFDINFGGHTEHYTDDAGRQRIRWVPARQVRGVAYDTPILGYRVGSANLLRLWVAEAVESFDVEAFNSGDYYGAVADKISSEVITKVLYPNDEPAAGKALRLSQQYLLVSCSLRDMIRIHLQVPGKTLLDLDEKYAVQLNDTHPALAVPELLRLLLDEHHLGWDEAWDVCTRIFGYTNHTLLPEALEQWPLPLFRSMLPRHAELVLEINHRFLNDVRQHYPGDDARLARMSLIDEHDGKYVRMAHLACVGSHAINGVSALHSQLLQKNLLRDFHELWPHKFSNKTNGVTPRRFLQLDNPALATLITERLGESWTRDLGELRQLEVLAGDAQFRQQWMAVKRANKSRLAARVQQQSGLVLDPDWLFDIHVKRLHEYKRQHLNLLHVITRYLAIKQGELSDPVPRVFLFAGKAAPGYYMAKLIIKLISAVGDVIKRDPDVNHCLRVAFLPNFSVKEAQFIYPAADLSEQISVAGKEASGTGVMKLAMNGALTIGTLDGANLELRDEVGAENFFCFGMDVDEVQALRSGGYRPRDVVEANPMLRAAIDLIAHGHFSGGDSTLFLPLVESLLEYDPFMVLADFASYAAAQAEVDRVRRDPDEWARRSILNTARSGFFSSDRTIREYVSEIWQASPVRL
jgi:starch phosphorylase